MKNKIFKFIKKVLLILLILFVLHVSFWSYVWIVMLHTYSNNYVTLNIYKKNKLFFQESSPLLLNNESKLWKYDKEKCIYDNPEKTSFICEKVFIPNIIFKEKLLNIWITNIKYVNISTNIKDKKNIDIIFYIDNSLYWINQYTNSIIKYTPYILYDNFSRYLPFPLSNKYFYIWSMLVIKDKYWVFYGENWDNWNVD